MATHSLEKNTALEPPCAERVSSEQSSGYLSSETSLSADDDGDSTAGDDDLEMPRKFSWVIDDLLCACGFPGKASHLRYLANQGVNCIVSLTAERQLKEKDVTDFKVVCLKVVDFTPPTLEQILQFVDVVEQAELGRKRVAVHCAAGKGRTGTVIASFLVKRFQLSASEAIHHTRQLRPGSVETSEQEDAVHHFEAHLLTTRVPRGRIMDRLQDAEVMDRGSIQAVTLSQSEAIQPEYSSQNGSKHRTENGLTERQDLQTQIVSQFGDDLHIKDE